MSLERTPRNQEQVVNVAVFPVAAYTMNVRDYVVRPWADIHTGAYTVFLPPVAEAAGKFYSIVARHANAINTVTINDNNNDSECWPGNITLNAPCDGALMYSDGLKWWSVASVVTYTHGATTPVPTTFSTGQV